MIGRDKSQGRSFEVHRTVRGDQMRIEQTHRWHSELSVGIGLVLMLIGVVAWALETQQQPQVKSAPAQVRQTPQQSQTQQTPSSRQAAPVPAESQRPVGQQSLSPPPPGEAELLHVLVGQSMEVGSPARIKNFSVSSPGVIDAVIKDSNHLQINGEAAGGVSLEVWDETGQSQIFYVYVEVDASAQAGQLPDAPPDNPAPAQVRKKPSRAWLGWVIFASVLLLAGAIHRMRRRRQPASYRFDLQAAKVAPNDGRAEPAPAPSRAARDEKPPMEETVTAAVTSPAGNPVKINGDAGELSSREIQEQAEAGSERLREQLRELKQFVEESRQQLASLAEAKLASLAQAVRDECGGQVAESIRERAQMMQEATDAGVISIKQAAEEAIAQLQAAEQKQETGFHQLAQAFRAQTQAMHETAEADLKSIKQTAEEAIAQSQAAAQKKEATILACASAAEERLTGVSAAVDALQGRAGTIEEDFGKAAQEVGGRWSHEFREQAQEAVEQLREEVKNSGQFVEESKQQLASLVEAKMASLDQAAANAVASLETAVEKLREEVGRSVQDLTESRERLASLAESKIALLNQVASSALSSLEAEQGRFRSQYQTSRREPGNAFLQRLANRNPSFDDHGSPSRQRGVVAMLSLAAGLFLVVAVTPWSEFLSTPPPVQMHLQVETPPDFADQSPYWNAKRRTNEEETAQAYWQAAASSLQSRYPFGSELPADPAPEFQIDSQYISTENAAAVTETRAHYWEKLRAYWGQRRFWIESHPAPEPETWSVRLRRLWETM